MNLLFNISNTLSFLMSEEFSVNLKKGTSLNASDPSD